PTQKIPFSSLITEKIEFSTWNDSRFHSRTPSISIKAGELVRVVIDKQPEDCCLEEVQFLKESDSALVDIVGTFFEREPGDVNARSFDDDVMGYDATDNVAEVLNYLPDKNKFDEMLNEI